MRILGNNKLLTDNASVTSSIPEYQRLFYTGATGTPFAAGQTVNGATSGATGIIDFVDPNGFWMDIKLPNDVLFFNPNQDQLTPSTEVITTTAGGSATTILDVGINKSGRPTVLHPNFPNTNIKNTNRNLITPAKSYQDNQERNFLYLRTEAVFTTPENISCVAIVGHNLTDTASITVAILNGVTTVAEGTVVNPNRIISAPDTQRAINNGTTRAANTDSNNIFIVYFPATYSATNISIDIVDTNNTDSYIWIGSVYMGEYWEPLTNTYYGWSAPLIDTSTTVYAQSPYSIERPKYHMIDLIFQNMSSSEADDWKYLFYLNGKTKDIIIDTFDNSQDNNEKANCYYCRFNTDNVTLVNDKFNSYSMNTQFRESI